MLRTTPIVLAAAGAGAWLAPCSAADPIPPLLPKQVAAPPADILDGTVRLPDPGRAAIESLVAVFDVSLGPGESWSLGLPIDDASSVRAALMTAEGSAPAWSLAPPGGRALVPEVERGRAEGLAATPVGELRSFPPAPPGVWSARVEAPADAAIEARLVVRTESPHALRSHVGSHRLVPGEAIPIVAGLRSDGRAGERAAIDAATLVVGGRSIEMLDDGAHGDGAAGDGVFGALVTPDRPGPLHARVEAIGMTEHGEAFVRTVDHTLAVTRGGVTLAGAPGATARVVADPVDPGSTLRIDIPAAFEDAGRRVLVAAEVWAADAPMVWAAMVTEPRVAADGSLRLSLHVDRAWLAGADTDRLALRNVRVHDLGTFVPVAVAPGVPLEAAPGLALPRDAGRAIDDAMLAGRPRADLALAPTIGAAQLAGDRDPSRASGAHNLLLSHGYCAGGNPWPPGDFSGFTEFFSDPNQNRSHDEFAQLLLAFGNNSKSYGIVGHSQGGNAALHLWTFYFSGLDWAEGPRLIQSVGTPYQGTPLALLGGFSCGVNNDLTPAGAGNWLSTIPSANRDDVYYWTTFSSGAACEFLANLFLSSPNDGVVEVSRGQLPGGNKQGDVPGWCHTTGMSQPAQYFDTARNSEMSTEAAR
jgi:hypothetical protein